MVSRVLCVLFGAASLAGAASQKNVLLICVDDLRPELGCYGQDYIQSPNIDALAARGRLFENHFVQAPTCGASRFALLTGRYGGSGNGALFDRAKEMQKDGAEVRLSMPGYFRDHGYTTVSVGKVSHHPGGRGGGDWDDDEIHELPGAWDRHLLPAGAWQHPRGWMHGLANGEIRKDAGDMDLFQALEGKDSIYPDGISTDEALEQLRELANDEETPFFMAFGILRPHLPFGAPKKYLDLYKGVELPPVSHPEKPEWNSSWHKSGEFMKYHRWGKDPNEDAEFALEVRRYYAACVSHADAQVGRILDELEAQGLTKDTIVVLWGDHGWHLGERAVWGKHTLFEESLWSPLILAGGGIDAVGESTTAVAETIDLFPTLAELVGLPEPDADGESLVPQIRDVKKNGQPAFSYSHSGKTVRTDDYRFIALASGDVELYDFREGEDSSLEVSADNPDVVEDLQALIDAQF